MDDLNQEQSDALRRGFCPDCGTVQGLLRGPEAGLCQNVKCGNPKCGAEFNITVVGPCQRIRAGKRAPEDPGEELQRLRRENEQLKRCLDNLAAQCEFFRDTLLAGWEMDV